MCLTPGKISNESVTCLVCAQVGPLHSLIFERVVVEDTGVYSCTARNALGQMTAAAAVRVIGEIGRLL